MRPDEGCWVRRRDGQNAAAYDAQRAARLALLAERSRRTDG